MLDWDDLHSFLAVARHGSLSAAARALGVQQTTMGRRLATLEARAGARLLQKTPRGYTLTAAGEAILGNVERIEGEALAIERSIAGRDVRLEGAVRLTTVEVVAVEVIVPAMPALRRRHPGITLDLAVDTRSLSLTMREADIALRLARLRQNDLAVRKVGELGFGLYAAPEYIEAHGMPDFGAGGAGHALVHNEADQMEQPEMVWLAGLLPQARPALRTNDRYAQRAAALAGIGIAFLARAVGDAAGLVRLDPPTPPPPRELWLAVHNDIRHTPRIRAVTDFLAVVLRAAAPRLAPGDGPTAG
jgi:DNA-binding transcriptional LysR family regulator